MLPVALGVHVDDGDRLALGVGDKLLLVELIADEEALLAADAEALLVADAEVLLVADEEALLVEGTEKLGDGVGLKESAGEALGTSLCEGDALGDGVESALMLPVASDVGVIGEAVTLSLGELVADELLVADDEALGVAVSENMPPPPPTSKSKSSSSKGREEPLAEAIMVACPARERAAAEHENTLCGNLLQCKHCTKQRSFDLFIFLWIFGGFRRSSELGARADARLCFYSRPPRW